MVNILPYNAVFSKAKAGKLHSGSKNGPIVKKKSQVKAIYMSEKAKATSGKSEYAASDQAAAIEKHFSKKKRK